MSEKIENRDFIVLTREALSQNQTVTFKVKGVSMWPFYKDQITSVTLKNERKISEIRCSISYL